MTDLDKLKSLLDEFGVPFGIRGPFPDENDIAELEISVPYSDEKRDKVIGYRGFCCDFTFDAKGKFISVGIWE